MRDSGAMIDWCTIADNHAGEGGIGAGGGIYGQNASASASWCIVWGNDAPSAPGMSTYTDPKGVDPPGTITAS